MKYVLCIALGLVIGHFGPISSAKWTLGTVSSAFHFTGKTLTVAGNFLK
jgi:hypothetical protein